MCNKIGKKNGSPKTAEESWLAKWNTSPKRSKYSQSLNGVSVLVRAIQDCQA
jgi:hypothetical protein